MRKVEKAFQDLVRELGCIACLTTGKGRTPCEIHHMLDGGRRMGELFVLGLCPLHHRSGRDDEEVTSRDQCQKRFEERYGTEESLLEKTREMIGWHLDATK